MSVDILPNVKLARINVSIMNYEASGHKVALLFDGLCQCPRQNALLRRRCRGRKEDDVTCW